VGLLDILQNDLYGMMNDLPIGVTFQGHTFIANRSAYRRDNSLRDGGFLDGLAMTITAAYDSVTQSISLGDILVIGARKFRVTSAELSQDAVSVDFNLEDINK
jgi:hypothetical protein